MPDHFDANTARDPDGIVSHRPAVRSLPLPARCLNVLVAEDDVVNRRVACRLLEKRGHRVVAVCDGREAIAAVGRGGFDIVLMDVQMPEVGGFEATALIREAERQTGGHIRIVAMTANEMVGAREQCLAAGMDGYLSKPLAAHVLFAIVEDGARAAATLLLAN